MQGDSESYGRTLSGCSFQFEFCCVTQMSGCIHRSVNFFTKLLKVFTSSMCASFTMTSDGVGYIIQLSRMALNGFS